MGEHWERIGRVFEECLKIISRVLGEYWENPGRVLREYWESIKCSGKEFIDSWQIIGRLWGMLEEYRQSISSVGRALGEYWLNLGRELGKSWENIGRILEEY